MAESGRKDEEKDEKKLTKRKEKEKKSMKDELRGISAYSDAGLRVAFG